jgi:hypothetical protein
MRGSMTTTTKRSLHTKPHGAILPVQDKLHEWLFFAKHKLEIVTVTSHLIYKATSLLDVTSRFKEKPFGARFKDVSGWLKKHLYFYLMQMNEAMHSPHIINGVELEFPMMTCPMLTSPHCSKQYIFNMDQTPLFFCYHCVCTLVKKGLNGRHVCKSTNNT